MRPFNFTQTGVGSTAWFPLDQLRNPFNIGFGVIASGTVNYTVQHTFSNLQNGDTITAFDHPDVAAETTSQDGTYAFPVTGIRVTVNSGTGSARLEGVQAGHARG